MSNGLGDLSAISSTEHSLVTRTPAGAGNMTANSATDRSLVDPSTKQPKVVGQDVSKRPINYNPGVHKTVLHVPGVNGVTDGTQFKGSIVMFMKQASTMLSKSRWGFQFHYNPNQINVSYSLDSKIVPSAADHFSSVLFAHQQTVSISLLLNRQMEQTETDPKALIPTCTPQQLIYLKRWGTLYDLDYLFSSVNGDSTLSDSGTTQHDIGYLQANIVTLSLGKNWRFPVMINQLNVTHTKFTQDMVPIMSQVDITATRFSTANPDKHLLTDE